MGVLLCVWCVYGANSVLPICVELSTCSRRACLPPRAGLAIRPYWRVKVVVSFLTDPFCFVREVSGDSLRRENALLIVNRAWDCLRQLGDLLLLARVYSFQYELARLCAFLAGGH